MGERFKNWFGENAAGIPGFQWLKDRNAQKDAEKGKKETAAANARLAEAMGLAGQQYQEQRPFQSAARQEALRNQLGLYGPANEMMREMSGGRYALDLNAPVERFPSPYNMQLAAQQAGFAEQEAAGQRFVDNRAAGQRPILSGARESLGLPPGGGTPAAQPTQAERNLELRKKLALAGFPGANTARGR